MLCRDLFAPHQRQPTRQDLEVFVASHLALRANLYRFLGFPRITVKQLIGHCTFLCNSDTVQLLSVSLALPADKMDLYRSRDIFPNLSTVRKGWESAEFVSGRTAAKIYPFREHGWAALMNAGAPSDAVLLAVTASSPAEPFLLAIQTMLNVTDRNVMTNSVAEKEAAKADKGFNIRFRSARLLLLAGTAPVSIDDEKKLPSHTGVVQSFEEFIGPLIAGCTPFVVEEVRNVVSCLGSL